MLKLVVGKNLREMVEMKTTEAMMGTVEYIVKEEISGFWREIAGPFSEVQQAVEFIEEFHAMNRYQSALRLFECKLVGSAG